VAGRILQVGERLEDLLSIFMSVLRISNSNALTAKISSSIFNWTFFFYF